MIYCILDYVIQHNYLVIAEVTKQERLWTAEILFITGAWLWEKRSKKWY
jgi:hypothetical protein